MKFLSILGGSSIIVNTINLLPLENKLYIMEEKTKLNDHQERQRIAIFRHQLNEFATCELKNGQNLKLITDQFKAKQSTKPIFDKLSFSKSAYNHFVDVQTFFEKIITRLTLFPILEKVGSLLNIIRTQYSQIFKFSNQKWGTEYKIVEQMLKSRANLSPIRNDLCLSCSENKWHQHIKSQKHQIFNLRIQDPFYYYNQATLKPKEVNGEEIDHKKLQQKLSELAFGVQMEQRCIKEILQNINQKEETMSPRFQEGQLQSQDIALPVMPMLRSVFQHTRGNKKICQEIGVQTYQIVEKPTKNIEYPHILNDFPSEKDKLQCKLITQLSDKTVHIKELEQKIILAEKTQKELKAQHNILIEENINLQKRNSVLQVQLNMSQLKKVTTKFKMAIKKKSLSKTKEEMSINLNNKSFNNQAQFNAELQKSLDQIAPNKIRGTTVLDSKFKSQNTPNKTMFIPNLHQNQKVYRQSITPIQHGSTISIEKASDKPDDEGLNSIMDFPSIRQSIHSNQIIHQKSNTVKFDSKKIEQIVFNQKKLNKIQKILKQELNKSKRKLKQITKKTINSESVNAKEWIRSQNHSPDSQQKNIRRVGKFQDRQSLLRMLYDSQVKECSDRSLNFDYFKKSYENFVLRIVGLHDSERDLSKISKLNHLHKKSTISIKQYFRNDIFDSKDQISVTKQPIDEKLEESRRYFRYSSCYRDIMNNLFAEESQIETPDIDQISSGKTILSNDQLKVTTQIFAYMIQLKVNNLSAYSKIKTIVSLQSGQRKKGSNFSEENKELKFSISIIIKNHRKCQYIQGHNYCKHIQSFIKNIASLMEK